jgi:hypothetical protein
VGVGTGVSRGTVTFHVLCEEGKAIHIFTFLPPFSYLCNLGIEKCHMPRLNNKFFPFLLIEFEIEAAEREKKST